MPETKEKTSGSARTNTPHFRPLGNRVLLKRLEAEETVKGGIYIPDSAKKKQEQAKVIAIGTGTKDVPIPVQVGDIVLMDKYSGQEVNLNEEEYVIVKSDDLIAIVEK
ncbi:MAG: co-chaperone GroES [Chlamydiia bacterium]|nr:co-chaperone GroES [Chlamydiia bacterium]